MFGSKCRDHRIDDHKQLFDEAYLGMLCPNRPFAWLSQKAEDRISNNFGGLTNRPDSEEFDRDQDNQAVPSDSKLEVKDEEWCHASDFS